MEAKTSEIEYTEDQLITFRDGIPGFDEQKIFALLQDDDYAPFEWLQSIDSSINLRFAVINPLLVYPNYEPDIGPAQVDDLKITKPEEVQVYVIATIYPDPSKSTVNLMGPIVINAATRQGKQVILDNTDYTTKEPILRK